MVVRIQSIVRFIETLYKKSSIRQSLLSTIWRT